MSIREPLCELKGWGIWGGGSGEGAYPPQKIWVGDIPLK